jgi:hypothetical protein
MNITTHPLSPTDLVKAALELFRRMDKKEPGDLIDKWVEIYNATTSDKQTDFDALPSIDDLWMKLVQITDLLSIALDRHKANDRAREDYGRLAKFMDDYKETMAKAQASIIINKDNNKTETLTKYRQLEVEYEYLGMLSLVKVVGAEVSSKLAKSDSALSKAIYDWLRVRRMLVSRIFQDHGDQTKLDWFIEDTGKTKLIISTNDNSFVYSE